MNEPIIDIGVNLMHTAFDRDREETVRTAEAAGVSPLIITGTSVAESRKALDYAARYPGKLYATAGVHPHDAKTCGAPTLAALRELAAHDAVVAIGECGLDYNRDFSPRPVQREWFEKQAALSVELGMPLFLHEREAAEDFIAILRNCGVKRMVVHCFTGGEAVLERCLEMGAFIGITGWICDERRGLRLRSLARRIPAGRLLLETDAPYLLPRSLGPDEKGLSGRNESRFLRHIARTVARCLGKDEELLAAETRENACAFFGIPLNRVKAPFTGR
jgi:TatD DNase family protein